jgi:two-component system, cell cycle sensor histidine kinase and response regulator CckA
VDLVRNGEEAIDSYQEAKKLDRPFAAVILDLTIRGGMGGKETIQKLLAFEPEVKAIVASGYNMDPVMQNFQEYGFKGALNKPFLINQLTEVLSGAIGAH